VINSLDDGPLMPLAVTCDQQRACCWLDYTLFCSRLTDDRIKRPTQQFETRADPYSSFRFQNVR